MRSEHEARLALDKYADTVRRICFVYLKDYHSAEDVFQDVFLKYVLHDSVYKSDAHEKAWLIRVAINACKDTQKSFFRKNVTSLEDLVIEPAVIKEPEREVLAAVLKLPQNYRNVIYLYYYEGYSAVEIAGILKKKTNTVYTWLSRAREQLKSDLGGEIFGE